MQSADTSAFNKADEAGSTLRANGRLIVDAHFVIAYIQVTGYTGGLFFFFDGYPADSHSRGSSTRDDLIWKDRNDEFKEEKSRTCFYDSCRLDCRTVCRLFAGQGNSL